MSELSCEATLANLTNQMNRIEGKLDALLMASIPSSTNGTSSAATTPSHDILMPIVPHLPPDPEAPIVPAASRSPEPRALAHMSSPLPPLTIALGADALVGELGPRAHEHAAALARRMTEAALIESRRSVDLLLAIGEQLYDPSGHDKDRLIRFTVASQVLNEEMAIRHLPEPAPDGKGITTTLGPDALVSSPDDPRAAEKTRALVRQLADTTVTRSAYAIDVVIRLLERRPRLDAADRTKLDRAIVARLVLSEVVAERGLAPR
jgi:hypothetical protein